MTTTITSESLSRRRDLLRMTPAEIAIRTAMLAVECAGADPRLTEAVTLLGRAQDAVADYVDGEERPSPDGERAIETGFVIEHPQSSPAEPRYLTVHGARPWAAHSFAWSAEHARALRFARMLDAPAVVAVSQHYQPELWQETTSIGPPRIAEHQWG